MSSFSSWTERYWDALNSFSLLHLLTDSPVGVLKNFYNMLSLHLIHRQGGSRLTLSLVPW